MDAKALQRAVTTASQIEADILGGGPLAGLVAYARREAIDATSRLLDVDPEDPKQIRKLQNAVDRYREMADWIVTQVTKGNEAWGELSREEREEVIALFKPHFDNQMDDT